MNHLHQYKESDDDDDDGGGGASDIQINLAPTTVVTKSHADSTSLDTSLNVPFKHMYHPPVGASHPFHHTNPLGTAQTYAMDPSAFTSNYHQFTSQGICFNPDVSPSLPGQANSPFCYSADHFQPLSSPQFLKKKRKTFGVAGSGDFKGPWSGYIGDENASKGPDLDQITPEEKSEVLRFREHIALGKKDDSVETVGTVDTVETVETNDTIDTIDTIDKINVEEKSKELGIKKKPKHQTSILHIQQARDYLGRSFLFPPTELNPRVDKEHKCYLPKKQIHTWKGHTKGVSAIRFFPRFGHLLLSAGLDSRVKLWDVQNKRNCIQTYQDHTKGIRDISFSGDGKRFVTCSYDRSCKCWDTETGQVIGTFMGDRVPHCVKFYPLNDNEFLTGGQDKKIVQWDIRSDEIVQSYQEHMGPVNTITFFDNNRRFATTGDDKSIRFWDYGIPVQIHYIRDPTMHSMPAVSLHPTGNWLAAQSMDNQILVFTVKNKFKEHATKRFKGHLIAGYACQPNFSPDGQFIMSGDGDGKVWFWDWKFRKIIKTLDAHKGVCIGAEWHPIEPSRIATCGWDGLIKYWD